MADISMRDLLRAGAHFGHQTRYWSPKMAPYIFGERNKIHIINLEKTLPMMREAMDYLRTVAAQRGKILFVGTKRQAGKKVRAEAMRCSTPYVDHRWLGGMLTNYKTVKKSITRLTNLEKQILSGDLAGLNKKEALTLERERAKLDRTLSGIKEMEGLPDALFVIDVEQEYIAVAEANKLGIPVVAVVDTNCSPDGIDYVIPGNDDSSRAIALYLQAAADSVIEGRNAPQVAALETGDEYLEVDDAGELVGVRPAGRDKPADDAKVIIKPKVSMVKPVTVDKVKVDAKAADKVDDKGDGKVDDKVKDAAAADNVKDDGAADKDKVIAADSVKDEVAVDGKDDDVKDAGDKDAGTAGKVVVIAGKKVAKRKVVKKVVKVTKKTRAKKVAKRAPKKTTGAGKKVAKKTVVEKAVGKKVAKKAAKKTVAKKAGKKAGKTKRA